MTRYLICFAGAMLAALLTTACPDPSDHAETDEEKCETLAESKCDRQVECVLQMLRQPLTPAQENQVRMQCVDNALGDLCSGNYKVAVAYDHCLQALMSAACTSEINLETKQVAVNITTPPVCDGVVYEVR